MEWSTWQLRSVYTETLQQGIACKSHYLIIGELVVNSLNFSLFSLPNTRIDAHFMIKITDFGLSEDMYVKNYFRQEDNSGVKLPVKWMAPESLGDGVFSEKSDVVSISYKAHCEKGEQFFLIPVLQWSFGVTMWEIFSGGKSPFSGIDPLSLLLRLEEGDRMPKPYNTACSDEM